MKFNVLFLSLLICLSAIGGEEPMVLKTASGDIFGTLLMPDNQQKVPVVLFISGSGPTDRDGNQPNMPNNSIKMVAESLAQNGIASLRFDKRGIAASAAAMEKEEDLRFESYINDVKAWITLLATDSRFSKVHVAGHSEGALIGTVASGGNFLVSSLILIAGTGQPADVVLKEQLKNIPPQLKDMVYPMIDKLKKGDTINNVPPSMYMLFRPSVQPYLISWFAYDPAAELKKVSVPVLILAGDKDIQVTLENADYLQAAKPGAVKVVIPNMNHVLKECATTDQMQQVAVYTNPTLPVIPQLLDELAGFLKKN